jgi:AcrR family transcriptional regulator
MPERAEPGPRARAPLNRERVVSAAVALADEGGIETLTMRRLGTVLGVEAMALYNHVRNKEDLLDGMVDYVFSQISLPVPGEDWKAGLRVRSLSAREVLGKHRWAVTLMDSRRSAGAARLRHDEAVVGSLLEGGFSAAMTARAVVLLDSFVFGFALTEASLADVDKSRSAELSNSMLEGLSPESFPYLYAFCSEPVIQEGYDFRLEFEPSLDLVLESLEQLRSVPGAGVLPDDS